MFACLSLLNLVSVLGAMGSLGVGAQSCSGPPYTVVSGDTCIGIANKIGTTFQPLEACNPKLRNYVPQTIIDANCDNLAIGEVLKTPGTGGPVCTPCDFFYTVQPGDICANIAATLGITLAQLECANPEINVGCTNLDIGELLCIPPAQ